MSPPYLECRITVIESFMNLTTYHQPGGPCKWRLYSLGGAEGCPRGPKGGRPFPLPPFSPAWSLIPYFLTLLSFCSFSFLLWFFPLSLSSFSPLYSISFIFTPSASLSMSFIVYKACSLLVTYAWCHNDYLHPSVSTPPPLSTFWSLAYFLYSSLCVISSL